MTAILLQSAYILHYRPYRDTSLLIDFFTREHGILSAVARGVRTAKSPLKGLLQPFIPLLISFSWKKELATLTQVESNEISYSLVGKRLFSAFYLNELTMKLLQRHDPHPQLYDYYQQALAELTTEKKLEIPLRRFEKNLLSELGYGLDLISDADTGQRILPNLFYHFLPQKGFCLDLNGNLSKAFCFSGKSLLALAHGDFNDQTLLPEMKQLLRVVIADLLGRKTLKSRDLFLREHYEST